MRATATAGFDARDEQGGREQSKAGGSTRRVEASRRRAHARCTAKDVPHQSPPCLSASAHTHTVCDLAESHPHVRWCTRTRPGERTRACDGPWQACALECGADRGLIVRQHMRHQLDRMRARAVAQRRARRRMHAASEPRCGVRLAAEHAARLHRACGARVCDLHARVHDCTLTARRCRGR